MKFSNRTKVTASALRGPTPSGLGVPVVAYPSRWVPPANCGPLKPRIMLFRFNSDFEACRAGQRRFSVPREHPVETVSGARSLSPFRIAPAN